MANEIKTRQPSLAGQDLYAIIDDAVAGTAWNGTAFDGGLGTWSTYCTALTESGTGIFSANVPAGINTPRLLSVTIYRRVGASRAANDAVVGVGSISWTGSAVATVSTPVQLDMTQAITDVKTATVGGSLAGSWSTAFGKVTKNLTSRILGIFGPGNTTGTPSATFLLDNALNPTTKTPQ